MKLSEVILQQEENIDLSKLQKNSLKYLRYKNWCWVKSLCCDKELICIQHI